MTFTIYLLLLTTLFVGLFVGVSAQSAAVEKWTRIDLGKNEVSIAVPPGFLVDADKRANGKIFRIIATENGVSMDVALERNTNARIDLISPLQSEQGSAFKIDKIQGKVISTSDPKQNFSQRMYLAAGDRFYTIMIEAPSANSAELTRFLYSILVNGKPLFKRLATRDFPEKSVAASDLKTSVEVSEALAKKIDKNASKTVFKKSSEFVPPPEPPHNIVPAILVDRPYPKPSGIPSRSMMEAKVIVTYLANGQIGDVVVYSDADKSFVTACADAARKIKFVPARDGNKSVDYVHVEHYSVMLMAIPVSGAFIVP
jgi:hypothetical protein